jgi:Domain of unknown function (DUF4276)
MTVHFLVEGPSERALLERWLPRVLKNTEFRVHPHQGKGSLPDDLNEVPKHHRRGLLDQLIAKLKGFATSKDSRNHVIFVLVDADDDDPQELATRIEQAVEQIALDLAVVVCLAVEETEAFYLGDLRALKKAFPRADLEVARNYESDSACGTWELFGRIVGDGGGNKVAWAEEMGLMLTTRASASRSPSFKKFVSKLGTLNPEPTMSLRGRTYRHPARPRTTPDRRRRSPV